MDRNFFVELLFDRQLFTFNRTNCVRSQELFIEENSTTPNFKNMVTSFFNQYLAQTICGLKTRTVSQLLSRKKVNHLGKIQIYITEDSLILENYDQLENGVKIVFKTHKTESVIISHYCEKMRVYSCEYTAINQTQLKDKFDRKKKMSSLSKIIRSLHDHGYPFQLTILPKINLQNKTVVFYDLFQTLPNQTTASLQHLAEIKISEIIGYKYQILNTLLPQSIVNKFIPTINDFNRHAFCSHRTDHSAFCLERFYKRGCDVYL